MGNFKFAKIYVIAWMLGHNSLSQNKVFRIARSFNNHELDRIYRTVLRQKLSHLTPTE